MTATLVMIDPQTVRRFAAGLLAMLALTAGAAAGQTPTRVTPPKNKYTPADDVRLGREAVDQIHEQVPMLTDTHLESYLDALGQNLTRSNPKLRPSSVYKTTTVDGRRALATTMDNTSEITGQPEQVALVTTTLRNGTLCYLIAVAPRSEAAAYSDAFARVGRTLRLRD
jgi:hypothetical protein